MSRPFPSFPDTKNYSKYESLERTIPQNLCSLSLSNHNNKRTSTLCSIIKLYLPFQIIQHNLRAMLFQCMIWIKGWMRGASISSLLPLEFQIQLLQSARPLQLIVLPSLLLQHLMAQHWSRGIFLQISMANLLFRTSWNLALLLGIWWLQPLETLWISSCVASSCLLLFGIFALLFQFLDFLP